jgi:single-strand DNA-binding protein
MSRDINYFFGIGNLTREPELRYTPQGTPVCRFGIAMNRRYQGKNGLVTEVTYINVSAWSKLAEVCARYLHKGSRVAVVGAIRSSSWEGKEGERRVSYEVRAENIQFLSSPRGPREEVRELPDFEVQPDAETVEPFTHEMEEQPLGELEDVPFESDSETGIPPF